MRVSVRGKNTKIGKDEVKYATEWMAQLILSNKMMRNLFVQVEFTPEYGLKGSTECLDQDYRPREFKICIDPNLSRRNQLLTLAHELVHVKQFAMGEMRYTKYTELIKWNKQTIHNEETEYWDLPWEIEAFGREYGMYIRYVEHRAKEKLYFN